MTETEISKYHSKDIMEFATVGVEFCKRIENAKFTTREEFVGTMLKILPLLYIKALIVLNFKTDESFYIEHFVKEDDYNAIAYGIAGIMKEYDDYLDVFVEDMKYSEEPIHCTVSESLADIYQEIADFLYVFKQNYEETTYAALCEISDSFAERWGQILVNVMRPLHEIKYQANTGIYQEDND